MSYSSVDKKLDKYISKGDKIQFSLQVGMVWCLHFLGPGASGYCWNSEFKQRSSYWRGGKEATWDQS